MWTPGCIHVLCRLLPEPRPFDLSTLVFLLALSAWGISDSLAPWISWGGILGAREACQEQVFLGINAFSQVLLGQGWSWTSERPGVCTQPSAGP